MADLITCLRIVCALLLIPCKPFSPWFFICYAVGGVSDALDGFAARHFGKETAFGARLDTAADTAFFAVLLVKCLSPTPIPLWMAIWIGVIALIKCVNVVYGLVKQGRFVAEHTAANKVCGALLFVLPVCIALLPRRALLTVMTLTCCAASFAAVQEGYFILTGK